MVVEGEENTDQVCDNLENANKEPEPVVKSDPYCFSCHRENTKLFCTTCVRSFHRYCDKRVSDENKQVNKRVSGEDKPTWRCPECLAIEKGVELIKQKQINPNQLKNVLSFMYSLLTTMNEKLILPFMEIKYDDTALGVVNMMDMNTVHDKIENGQYTCCEDFLTDIKWIFHNTQVHESGDQQKVRTARLMLSTAKEEVYDFQLCEDCYVNYDETDDTWFTLPCTKPHLLLWAKQRTFPHWPAKLMRYNSENKTVDVRYFGGEHLRATIPSKDCLLYSRNNPSTATSRHKTALTEATAEAEQYIENLVKNYRAFNYAEPGTFLRGNSLERHMYDTIPNAWKALGKTEIPPPIEIAASATSARRLSAPMQRTKRLLSTAMQAPVEPIRLGRTMTRRLSTLIESGGEANLFTKKKEMAESAAARRMSLQCDRPLFEISAPFSGQMAGQKRNMLQNDVIPSKIQRMSHAPIIVKTEPLSSVHFNGFSDTAFKIPIPPNYPKIPQNLTHPINSTANIRAQNGITSPKSKQATFNFSPSSSVHPFPELSPSISVTKLSSFQPSKSTHKNSTFTPSKTAQKTPDFTPLSQFPKLRCTTPSKLVKNPTHFTQQKPAPTPTQKTKTVNFNESSWNLKLSPEMSNMCKSAVDNNLARMTASMRNSLNQTLVDFLNAAKLDVKIKTMKDDLIKQRKFYCEKVIVLTNENTHLKTTFVKLKDKYVAARKAELELMESKKKMTEMAEELNKANAQIATLTEQMSEKKVTELNDELEKAKAEITELNEQMAKDSSMANQLKTIEEELAELTEANKHLVEANEKLSTEFDGLQVEHNMLNYKLEESEKGCREVSEQVYAQWTKEVKKTKRKQWCFTCGIPGDGPYYCSKKCEEERQLNNGFDNDSADVSDNEPDDILNTEPSSILDNAPAAISDNDSKGDPLFDWMN